MAMDIWCKSSSYFGMGVNYLYMGEPYTLLSGDDMDATQSVLIDALIIQ